MIVPAFHFKILEDYLPIFNNAGEILVAKLNKEIGQDVTDIQPFLTAYTLDIICETAMGTTVNAQENHNNEYMKCIEDMNQIFSQRVLSVWKKIDRLFVYSNDYKIQTKALNYIHTYDDSVIAKRRELLLKDQNKDTEEITDDFEIKKRRAFLDVLLKSTVDGKPLKNHEIREEVDTIMFGGQDTCSGTLGFMFYALSKHPKIQAKLVEELKEIFGNDIKRLPTVEDFSKMKYTELVIKETLRYYQTVPFIARQLTEDVIYNGILYPKDTNIMIMPYYMHRRTDLFENPEEFNPDRFLYENNQNRNPFSYIPFSAGPRNCLGQKFAMFELKLTIIKVLLNYEIKPVASKYDPILSCGMMLRSINGISIKLEKRKLH